MAGSQHRGQGIHTEFARHRSHGQADGEAGEEIEVAQDVVE